MPASFIGRVLVEYRVANGKRSPHSCGESARFYEGWTVLSMSIVGRLEAEIPGHRRAPQGGRDSNDRTGRKVGHSLALTDSARHLRHTGLPRLEQPNSILAG
jgi:hypothetical protein